MYSLQAPVGKLLMLHVREAARVVHESAASVPAYLLAEKGVPLVLAMQHEIGDSDALQFVKIFYSVLVAMGSVEVALSRACWLSIPEHGVKRSVRAMPVLLIRGSRSDLFAPRQRWKRKLAHLFRRARIAD